MASVVAADGEGGSVALLAGDGRNAREALEAAVQAVSPSYRLIPIRLAREGLVISEEAGVISACGG